MKAANDSVGSNDVDTWIDRNKRPVDVLDAEVFARCGGKQTQYGSMLAIGR